MLETYLMMFRTLWADAGAALWAMAIFAVGFALAFPVVRYEVKGLMALPQWMLGLARRHLRPETGPVTLCAFIFGFNSVAIFTYMISGGLVVLPAVFDLLTGLNVGAILLIDAQEPIDAPIAAGEQSSGPRAWVGFLTLLVIGVELTSFWFSVGMGINLGRAMGGAFSWDGFAREAGPRVTAYILVIVPALLASAVAETAAIKAMMQGPAPGQNEMTESR